MLDYEIAHCVGHTDARCKLDEKFVLFVFVFVFYWFLNLAHAIERREVRERRRQVRDARIRDLIAPKQVERREAREHRRVRDARVRDSYTPTQVE